MPTPTVADGRRPDLDRAHAAAQPPSLLTRLGDDARATRAIAKEDLRMLLEIVTGVSLHRAPSTLSAEQAAANQAEHDHHPGMPSAYAKPGAPPKLTKPVLMIPGLMMDASSYDPLAGQLDATGANGQVAVFDAAHKTFHLGGLKGPVVSGKQLAQIKLFQLQYINPKAAPSDKEPQIAAALAAIQSATGASTVDVVTHSAGGTDFRLYLQERDPTSGPAIGDAVLIGPASHGTAMGNAGKVAGGPFGVAQAGGQLAMHSQLIDMLNTTWDHQRDQITGSVTIIAVGGTPTVGPHGISDGDGFMPTSTTSMPRAETVYLRGIDPTVVAHLREVEYAGVIAAVQDALARGAVSTGAK